MGVLNEENESLGEGSQPDGVTAYNGYMNREVFPTVRNGRVPNPIQNWNSFANRVEAFKTFLTYCRRHDLKFEFWDVHFCQRSSKQVHTKEKNKAKKYHNAFRVFIDREDEEFAEARDHRMHLNSTQGGAPLVSPFGMGLSGA